MIRSLGRNDSFQKAIGHISVPNRRKSQTLWVKGGKRMIDTNERNEEFELRRCMAESDGRRTFAISEAFDETLTREEVMAIVRPFIRS